METSGSLRFLGNPGGHCPCSSTPAGSGRLSGPRVSCLTRPPPVSTTKAPSVSISGLNHTTFDLTVYASQEWLPSHHARLAFGAGPALPGGIRYPQGSNEISFQTDLEFSPLRPEPSPVPGSDRFRIFSAQAKGAFQCHEISPRVRFALEQSGESRRQVRDALGAGEAKDRYELGAGGLGMVLRQVGEGSAGRRAGATRASWPRSTPYRLHTASITRARSNPRSRRRSRRRSRWV